MLFQEQLGDMKRKFETRKMEYAVDKVSRLQEINNEAK